MKKSPVMEMAVSTANPSDVISLAGVQSARRRIVPFVKRTPLIRNQTLSHRLGTNVYLKLEMFQRTGAFKIRGAFNKMLCLTARERRRGVVAVSGGNHAQAVACAARQLGVRALVLMPESTPLNYLDATRRYGAEVILTKSINEAFGGARAYQASGYVYIHPFDDPLVIEGQGTIGLEILEDLPQVTDVFVSIGGGGLAGGIGATLKTLKPEVRIWGVETKGTDSMARALAANRVVELQRISSIARTLGAPAVSETTLALAQRYLQNVTVVSDSEALAALFLLLERAKIVTEPAASCTLAAAERLKENFSDKDHLVLILCGGNLALDDLFQREGRGVEIARSNGGKLTSVPHLF